MYNSLREIDINLGKSILERVEDTERKKNI